MFEVDNLHHRCRFLFIIFCISILSSPIYLRLDYSSISTSASDCISIFMFIYPSPSTSSSPSPSPPSLFPSISVCTSTLTSVWCLKCCNWNNALTINRSYLFFNPIRYQIIVIIVLDRFVYLMSITINKAITLQLISGDIYFPIIF